MNNTLEVSKYKCIGETSSSLLLSGEVCVPVWASWLMLLNSESESGSWSRSFYESTTQKIINLLLGFYSIEGLKRCVGSGRKKIYLYVCKYFVLRYAFTLIMETARPISMKYYKCVLFDSTWKIE